MDGAVVTINAGSSSVKFALFRDGKRIESGAGGRLDDVAGFMSEVGRLLRAHGVERSLVGVGHRIVHGGSRFFEPVIASGEILAELRQLMPFDPEHLPAEIALVEACTRVFAGVPQVLCFDTAFHRDLPIVARMLAIPRKYFDAGVRRYGFHGLSYTYLMQELERVAGAKTTRGRVILAHLGNGASMASVREGRCVDTTMAFTPTAGLVMGTRSGDLDPGIAAYLARSEGMSAEQFAAMASSRSGMLGVSETSSDVRELLEREKSDPRAAEAIGLFCFQARKWIGALAAGLGGLDVLVFSGGIGENSAVIRGRICEGLEFLGIDLDAGRNERGEAVISREESMASVRVIRTDEESVIAEAVCRLIET